MKAKIIENKMLIKLDFTVADFNKASRYDSTVGKLYDDDGNEVFVITPTAGDTKLSDVFASFNCVNDKCLIWVDDIRIEDSKEFVLDTYSGAFKHILEAEVKVAEILEEIKNVATEVSTYIEAIEG